MKAPLNYHGCAFTLPKDDKRLKRFAKQRKTRGFDDSETWSLYNGIARYTLPRLKRFREIEVGTPGALGSRAEWNKILDDMIAAFQILAEDNPSGSTWKQEDRIIKRGLTQFAKWAPALWW